MNNVTITEKYALCMLKRHNKLCDSYVSSFYLTVSMLLEMMFEGCIEITDKNEGKIFRFDDNIKILLNTKMPKQAYSQEIYKHLQSIKKDDLSIVKALCSISDHNSVIKPIANILKEKMVKDELISLESKKGLFRTKEIIKVSDEKFKETTNEIRENLLKTEDLNKETILLTSLLNSTNFIKDIFTKYEKDDLKKRIKEVSDTEINKYVNVVTKIIAARESVIID